MSGQGEIMRVGIIGSRTYENKRKIREMIWKLNYVDKLAEYSQSIYTLFGSAFHETLQAYLTIMYE